MQLRDLARGAALLGSGGGGDPRYDLLMTQVVFEKYGAPQIITVQDLKDEDLVAPLCFMGAPLVFLEKIPSGKEFDAIFDAMEQKPTVLVASEIGGANAFVPLMVGAKLGLPVLDGDLIGRAFPELQMSAPSLKGISAAPAYVADVWGNCKVFRDMDDFEVERQARNLCVEMGSSAAVCHYVMSGAEAREAVVAGTLSQALELGRKRERGTVIGKGTITDINQQVVGGFLIGTVHVGDLVVHYQNEYLKVTREAETLARSPLIISLIEEESGEVVHTESLQFGLRVEVTTLPAPAIWLTKEGLERCA